VQETGQNYSHIARIARRITVTLFATHGLVSAAFVASGSMSVIVAAQLADNPAWAGVPSSVMRLGMAFAALVVAAGSDRIGRRWGLALGLALAAVGMVLAVTAIANSSYALFLGASLLAGVGSAAMALARFAAAEVHLPRERGRAISRVVIGGAVGSAVGPLVVGPSGRWAQQMGMNELVGPHLVALAILPLASALIFLRLRPDPRDVGRQIAELHPESVVHRGAARPVTRVLRTPPAFVALVAMLSSQVIMSMLMGMTTLHMRNSERTLTDISLVMSVHVLGMFGLSTIVGRLTDSWGRGPVILMGSVLLILSCVLAPMSSEVLPLSMAMFLLGLAWNLCYVGGSALLTDHLSPDERARTQGANDFLVALATAVATAASGVVYAGRGYSLLSSVGMVASAVPLALTTWWLIGRWRAAAASRPAASVDLAACIPTSATTCP
jgi:MFS family permease